MNRNVVIDLAAPPALDPGRLSASQDPERASVAK
jgi:hypothetical protein